MLVAYSYYHDTWLGNTVSQADFPKMEMLAEDAINHSVRNALKDFEGFDEDVQTAVKKAICAQIDYYGVFSDNVGFSADEVGFTVGKVTVQGGDSGSDADKLYICPRATMYLELTGLLNRNVGVIC